MPTKAPDGTRADSRARPPSSTTSRPASTAPTRPCSPSTAGSRSPRSPTCGPRCGPAATDYKIFKNTLAKRAANDAGLDDLARLARRPGCDRLRAQGRRRRGHRRQGAARLRQDEPEPRRQGRVARDPRAERPPTSRPSPTCRPATQLLARLAGGFQAPMVKAAGLFQAFTRNFAYGVKAYIDQTDRGGRSRRRRPETPSREAAGAAEAEPAPAAAADAPSRRQRPRPRRRQSRPTRNREIQENE